MYTIVTEHEFAKGDATQEMVLDGLNEAQRDDTTNAVYNTRTGNEHAHCRKNDITFDVGDSTSGTLTLLSTPFGYESGETIAVKDSSGTAIVLTIGTDDLTVSDIVGSLSSLSVTKASVNGTGNITATISGGDS